MKRTFLFTTALATAAGLFAMGAAQASDKSDKAESRNAHESRFLYASGQGNEYRERNVYAERNEYREREDYHERENEHENESHDDDSNDD
ncbi:MAG: hypothetical protein WBN04_16940 [Paracoccaceae bacterium]